MVDRGQIKVNGSVDVSSRILATAYASVGRLSEQAVARHHDAEHGIASQHEGAQVAEHQHALSEALDLAAGVPGAQITVLSVVDWHELPSMPRTAPRPRWPMTMQS